MTLHTTGPNVGHTVIDESASITISCSKASGGVAPDRPCMCRPVPGQAAEEEERTQLGTQGIRMEATPMNNSRCHCLDLHPNPNADRTLTLTPTPTLPTTLTLTMIHPQVHVTMNHPQVHVTMNHPQVRVTMNHPQVHVTMNLTLATCSVSSPGNIPCGTARKSGGLIFPTIVEQIKIIYSLQHYLYPQCSISTAR